MPNRKFLLVLLILIVGYIKAESAIFNRVINNELESTEEYDFTSFLKEFAEHSKEKFLCIDKNDYGWELYSVYEIAELDEINNILILNRKLPNSDCVTPVSSIHLDELNFMDFFNCFITNQPLQFNSGIDVKFLKVKTLFETGEIRYSFFSDSSQLKEDTIESGYFVYAYKKKTIGNKEMVLLAEENRLPETFSSNSILGWVPSKVNGEKVNVVLWNTNIGIRPKDNRNLTRAPLVFEPEHRSDISLYRLNGDYHEANTIVSKSGIEEYLRRFREQQGRILRWLPMYMSRDDLQAINIGVLEEVGNFRNAFTKTVFTGELYVYFLVDASISMTDVWDNLPGVLTETLKNLTRRKITNAAGYEISIKSKLYYFNDECFEVNQNYFQTASDVNEYKIQIANIRNQLNPTNNYYPPLQQALDKIINDARDFTSVVIVIGDTGDAEIDGDIVEIPRFAEPVNNNLMTFMGIPYASQFDHHLYEDGLKQFKKNFSTIVYDISEPAIMQNDIDDLSLKLSNRITSEIKQVFDRGKLILKGEKLETNAFDNLTVFSRKYLERNYEKLVVLTDSTRTKTAGTYFEEGSVVYMDSNGQEMIEKDVLITQDKIEKFLAALQNFRIEMSDAAFVNTFRIILATFFMVQKDEIDPAFFREKELTDFWNVIVGKPELAKKLLPDLYAQNCTLQKILDSWEQNSTRICNNASDIWNILTSIIYERRGELIISESKPGNVIFPKKSYWVPVEDINLFKGIDFE